MADTAELHAEAIIVEEPEGGVADAVGEEEEEQPEGGEVGPFVGVGGEVAEVDVLS